MEKTLSIIVPTYNMEKYLRKCLDSLIVSDENMQLLEVLVINDGSKDSSSQIAHEYEAKYPQTFRVIDKENGNYGSCINRGLKEATGKYVKVLDADDYFNPQVLDDFISYLGNTDVDLVISDFNVVDEAGTCLSEFTFDLPLKREFKLKDIPNEMNTKLLHHCITYKRKVFDRFSFKQTEGISYTDDEWIFEPMMWIDAVTYYPHTLYLYLRGREGQTFDPNVIKRTLEHRVIVAKEMTEFHEANIRFCKTENVPFVTEKLARRIKAVYNCHLILYNTAENRHRIIDFDRYLKQKSIKVYDEINMMTNNYGWHYIRQWRKLGYSNCSPALVFIRLKRYIDRKLNGKTVKIDKMPAHLKRKEI